MANNLKCPLCESSTHHVKEPFHSGELDIFNREIVLPDVLKYVCDSKTCEHSWIPHWEEERIEHQLLIRSREFLNSEQIAAIREALGFTTKTAASTFLGLNAKAFTKWERGYTEPNPAYDLLLRLAVRSEDNFKFIKELHRKRFAFEFEDYELVCKMSGAVWSPEKAKAEVHYIGGAENFQSSMGEIVTPYEVVSTSRLNTTDDINNYECDVHECAKPEAS